ncbi:DUF3592 domain-containing protein [Streptomonospora wellingtoniae]|uniref:DUF3592 domain-containing protein n=1 Tax=Streptomonospora wellingtoniae TaxID=3075544 RepID=A0ABU2KRA5_9ACTN|nr:DUF3592 domain-containing protein [Streptomonospora sp. DSM 45055]MDT0301663.1 DUF3592 domain-containing protein [Streptomonospora sp. DSM 45055]
MAYVYPLLPIGAGVVMLWFLLRHLRFSMFLALYGVQAEGEVVGYRETATSASMVVRFSTPDGREVHAAHENTGWTASRSGDIVTVSYDPGDPERARIVAAPWLSNWVLIMIGVLGFLLVGIGLVLGWLAWSEALSGG